MLQSIKYSCLWTCVIWNPLDLAEMQKISSTYKSIEVANFGLYDGSKKKTNARKQHITKQNNTELLLSVKFHQNPMNGLCEKLTRYM